MTLDRKDSEKGHLKELEVLYDVFRGKTISGQ